MMAKFGMHLSTWNGVLQLLVVILFSPVLVGMIVLEALVTKYLLFAAMVSTVAGCYFFVIKSKMKSAGPKSM
jgi:hypothetical protein